MRNIAIFVTSGHRYFWVKSKVQNTNTKTRADPLVEVVVVIISELRDTHTHCMYREIVGDKCDGVDRQLAPKSKIVEECFQWDSV